MTLLLVALLLGASAQSTGSMSPTSDVSGNRVRATGASTSRALRDRMAEVANVLDFGAVGNGTTNDTAAVQAAINTGRPVLCPAGYVFSVSGLTLSTADQRFYGPCKVKLRDVSNAQIFSILADGVVIDGPEIDGSKDTQSTVDETLGAGIWLANGVDNVSILNSYIHDVKRSGVTGYGNHTGCRVEGNRISDVGFIAIRPSLGSGYPASGWVIARNVIERPGQDGIGTTGIQRSTITGNTIKYPTVSGIALEARCDDTAVTGNAVEGDGVSADGKCVQVNDSRNVTVSGNSCTALAGGILLAGGATSGSVSVSGNTLDATPYMYTGAIEVDASQNTPSLLDAYHYSAVISGNTIRNAPHAGIFINAASGVTVQGNSIYNWDTVNDVTTNRYMAAIVLRSYSHDNLVQGNVIKTTAPAWYRVGILESGDGLQNPLRNRYLDNQIEGVEQDYLVTYHGFYQSKVRRWHDSNSAPTAGTWVNGQQALRAAPTAGLGLGWVVTSGAKFGSFGTAITATVTGDRGQSALAASDLIGIHPGMAITIPHGGDGGVALSTFVMNTNRTDLILSIDPALGSTVAADPISLTTPAFTDLARVAPSPIRYTGALDFDPVSSGSCDDSRYITTSDSGTAQVGADCAIGLPAGLTNGLAMSCRVPATGIVTIRACNVTAAPLDPPSLNFSALVFNPNQ